MTAPRQSNRAFGLTFAAFFAILATIAWFGFGRLLTWAIVAALAFFLVALALPLALLPLNRLWGRLGRRVGTINNHLILGVVFFGFITPIAFLMRLAGRDPMSLRLDRQAPSYLTPVNRQMTAETIHDLF